MTSKTDRFNYLDELSEKLDSFLIDHGRSPDLVYLLLKEYPGIEVRQEVGSDAGLRKLNPGQVWCCDSGSGEVEPVRVAYASCASISYARGVERVVLDYAYVSPVRRNDGSHYEVHVYEE